MTTCFISLLIGGWVAGRAAATGSPRVHGAVTWGLTTLATFPITVWMFWGVVSASLIAVRTTVAATNHAAASTGAVAATEANIVQRQAAATVNTATANPAIAGDILTTDGTWVSGIMWGGIFLACIGRHRVQVVCMDLAASYRALVRKHFPQARIVADRFHVIRTINHHFLACWKEIDPVGAKHRGLLSLMRRHRHNLTLAQHERLSAYLRNYPALEAKRWLRDIAALRCCALASMVALGNTLHACKEEIATMWRFTAITALPKDSTPRQAYGFRNFQNYRLRVGVMCS